MKYLIICFLSVFLIGCENTKDFGQVSNNPCETTYCKQHKNGTSICVFKCKDGIYALESNKLKLSEDLKSYNSGR